MFQVILSPMPFTTIFFDLDDTLYPSSTGLWDLIGDRIGLFMHNEVGLKWEIIPDKRRDLFVQYGTTLRGLVVEYQIDPRKYLDFVHDVPVEKILKPSPGLREKISTLNFSKIIFTNADRKHAQRVISNLELDDCFDQIIDICDMDPYCKPQLEAFQRAMKMAGNLSPNELIIIDDTPQNLETALQLGCYTIQVGTRSTVAGVDAHIDEINLFDQVLPKI